MRDALSAVLDRARREVRSDLQADPALGYVLALAALLCGFWFWYRAPSFAGADEYSRLLDPMKGVGYLVADPGWEGLHRGLTDGRALGATFYLYGLVLVPLFVVIVATGQFDAFASLGSVASRWTLWHEVPAWFWTGSILLGRLTVVAIAVGCVYLTYRIGTALRDRRTGRYAAVLLSLTLGFVSAAHEIGEDVPMLFLFLLATYAAIRYYQSGAEPWFLAGAGIGGLAIAVKLTAGVVVFVIGAVYALRAHREHGRDLAGFVQPRLLGLGLLLGGAAVYVGFPSVLVGGPEHLVDRVLRETARKGTASVGAERSIWGWILRGYLAGMGLPLFLATSVGAVASVATLRDDAVDTRATLAVALAPVAYLVVFSRFSFLGTRHLLPSVPGLLIVLAIGLGVLRDRRPPLARALVAALLLSTAAYTGVGTFQYATDDQARATAWMEANVEPDETVEVYENSVSDVAAVHGRPLQHYPYDEENATDSASLVLDEAAYTEWMTSMPDRGPDYVQLTASELRYTDPTHPKSRAYPRRAAYVRGLLEGEYEYRVVAEFGDPPSDRTGSSYLWTGLVPDPGQPTGYYVILERTSEQS